MQRGEIQGVEILSVAGALGRFEIHREFCEAAIVQEISEGVDAEVSLADVLVAIDSGGEGLFAIVQMKRAQMVQTDDAIELLERLGEFAFRAERVAGGEEMAGVEANSQSRGILGAFEQFREVFEAMAQAGPLPRGRFEPDLDLVRGRGSQNNIERGNDIRQSLLFFASGGRAGMENDARQAKLLGPIEFNAEGLDRFVAQFRIGTGEVDQIAGVAARFLNIRGLDGLVKAGGLLVGNRLRLPLGIVLCEDLDGCHAERGGGLDRLVVASGD